MMFLLQEHPSRACVTSRLLGIFRLLLGNSLTTVLLVGYIIYDRHLAATTKTNIFNPCQTLVSLSSVLLVIEALCPAPCAYVFHRFPRPFATPFRPRPAPRFLLVPGGFSRRGGIRIPCVSASPSMFDPPPPIIFW